MNDDILTTWARKNRPLFRRVMQFNYLPAAYIHPDRRSAWMNHELWDRIVHHAAGQRELSGLVFRRLDLQLKGFFDFAPARRRFALLERETLNRLARYAGAALASQRIARVIDRNEAVQLKQELGEEVYRFAVKRAPFLLTEAVSNGVGQDGAVEELGWRCLARCCAGDPPELVERMRLKCPPPHLNVEFPDHVSDDERNQAANLLKKVLLAEVEPELKSCFK